MIKPNELPDILSPLYAGDILRAWVFCCWKCRGWQLDLSANGETTKTDATERAREYGWSKTVAGWLCPACKEEQRRAT